MASSNVNQSFPSDIYWREEKEQNKNIPERVGFFVFQTDFYTEWQWSEGSGNWSQSTSPATRQKSCYHAHCLDFYFVVVQYPINQHHLTRPKTPAGGTPSFQGFFLLLLLLPHSRRWWCCLFPYFTHKRFTHHWNENENWMELQNIKRNSESN